MDVHGCRGSFRAEEGQRWAQSLPAPGRQVKARLRSILGQGHPWLWLRGAPAGEGCTWWGAHVKKGSEAD